MTHSIRAGDPPDERVTVERKIPLWGLITAIGTLVLAIAGQALLTWTQVQSLAEQLKVSAATQARTGQQIDTLLERFSAASTKDREHDILIANLTARLTALENVFPRQILTVPAK